MLSARNVSKCSFVVMMGYGSSVLKVVRREKDEMRIFL